MVPELRREFNAKFTPEHYTRFLARLNERCGVTVGFRNCETPCFFPRELIDRMALAGEEMIRQLTGDSEYLAAADSRIPPRFLVPATGARPLFVQADFGIVRTENGYEPKLVEIQGFPSLYAYQPELAQTYGEIYGIGHPYLIAPLANAEQHRALLAKAILNGFDPENVVLLEIDPFQQKTLADFLLTARDVGIPIVDIAEVRKRGRKLFYERGGREVPIHRIYNRAIVDELIRKDAALAFDFRDDLEVEWAGHPNWFFRISKFSLPYLTHPAVPRSRFLSEVTELPEDPEKLVLKPLFSFAGHGVIVGPTREQIDAVPPELRPAYLLQERVAFHPVIETPHGPTHAEVRIMYIWDGEPLRAVNTIIRLGRGKMMGVDHNRDKEWVGGSAGFLI